MFFGILACIAFIVAIVFLVKGRKGWAILFGIAFLALPSIGGAISDSMTPQHAQPARAVAHHRPRPARTPNRHAERDVGEHDAGSARDATPRHQPQDDRRIAAFKERE
jgi:hypothetical protein